MRALDRGFSGDRSFSLRNQFPDAWYDLNNPDTVDPAAACAPSCRSPPRTSHRTSPSSRSPTSPCSSSATDALADELTITVAAPHRGRTVPPRPVRCAPSAASSAPAGPVARAWQVFIDAAPVGDWELQLEDTPIVRKLFADGVIQDLVVVFTLSGTTPRRT